jgi:N-acetylglucosaminyldiphosphoundecaprenol N-acetyl-beta-D-mannosaminyltransferase
MPHGAEANGALPTIDLDGLCLARLGRAELVDQVFAMLARGRGGWVITANVDHLRLLRAVPELRAVFETATLRVADGAPLLWAARLQGTPLPERVAGSDLVGLLAARAAREGRSLYLLGGDRGAAEAAAARLCAQHRGLTIAGYSAPRVSTEPGEAELAPLREALRAARPDLVYVALGSPKELHVIRALRPALPGAWWLGVGISLSFLAGHVRRAPHWMQRSGLEWLHRLVQEPRRLARRYLIDDLPFALRLLAGAWHARR